MASYSFQCGSKLQKVITTNIPLFWCLVASFLIIYTAPSVTAEYYCWEQADRLVLKFINNVNKSITHLPSVRLIQGFYDSQFAMQYAAYVYLQEKMGVNTEFYPENDPNALFRRYTDYPGWCKDIQNPNAPNVTCSDYAPYPEFYFEDIGDDHYDLLFEIWDIIGVRDAKYIETDTITNGGMSGVFGEGGWFIPKYMYEQQPDWTLPYHLKHNQTVRQTFIDAYTIHSDRNYIERWWKGMGSSIDDYIARGYGVPNDTQPIVWGSSAGYEISTHSHDLVSNLLGGLHWTFVAFGSESNLTEFVKDLYAKQLPFIAVMYSPHKDFATVLENSTEYMQFERISLPRNPDNNPAHACYEGGLCSFPLSPLLKMGNPKFLSEFEEMARFLAEFRMTTDDVNAIMGYHAQAATYDLSPHERWINATCAWLKQSEATTNEWHQTITRYDCIFEGIEQSGCGFHYYYETFEDATTEQNAIALSDNDSIGGSCAYDTNAPLCICSNGFFIGSTCRTSCPGTIGPIHESTYTDTTVVTDNYTFHLCSGHGICDISTKKCTCQLGYGGDGCEVTYEVFEYPRHALISWSCVYGVLNAILIASGLWVYCNREYKTIRALSVNLTLLFTFGLILLCVSNMLYLFHPMNDILCNVQILCQGIGAIVTIMAPLCKTYRIVMIFNSRQKIVIKDKTLVVYIIYGIMIETAICVTYAVFHQLNGGVQEVYWDEYERIEYKCNMEQATAYVFTANCLYIITLIIILCYLSFKNRKTIGVFKESRCAFFGSFFSLFVFLVVFIFHLVVNDISVVITIQSGAMFISICVIWVLFYGIRMYIFFKHPDERSKIVIRQRTAEDIPVNIDTATGKSSGKSQTQSKEEDKTDKTGRTEANH
eukprot:50712_1